MSNNLKVLADNRDALLLAEVAAWLHMFGKLHEKFLKGNHDLDTKIPSDVPTDLSDLFTDSTWTGNIWNRLPIKEFRAKGLSISNLIKRHRPLRKGSAGFIQLIADAHGRGSGIEKGILDRFASTQQINVYLSTSLGHETNNNINLTTIQSERQNLYDFLNTQLQMLRKKNANLAYDVWLSFLDEFIQKIERDYRISVAETRRPLNDVTLLDQTAISVAFFKAALAQNLLLGKWKDPYQDKVVDKYRWRLLRVGLNGLTFWGNSARVGDLLARKGRIEDALNKIQLLLEVMYPLGSEVYRDENGSIFIAPDVDDLLAYTDSNQSLEALIQSIADQEFSGETEFSLSLSSSTRDTLLFGRLVSAALPQPAPQPNWLKQQWHSKAADICPVCGLRPQGPGKKAMSRKVCDVCQGRRLNRSREWTKNPSTTIWIDEVADVNGQLVLLVAQFDLVDWLSGTSFNTILSFDTESRLLSGNHFDLHTLIEDIQNGLAPGHKFEDNLLGYLVADDQRGGSDIIQDFYDLHVTYTDLGAFSPTAKPELLALSMIRQFPSFARINRVWETTKKFWEEIESTFQTTVGPVNARLKIQGIFLPNAASQDTLEVSHTYEIRLGNTNLSITCTKEREFLTVDNLHRLAVLLGAAEEFQQNYDTAARYVYNRLRQDESLEVEEPTGYGSPNRLLGRLRIEGVILEPSSYLPAISILTEPRTFMALVPADKALNVAKAIKAKYEEEISKVRNRLPLKMGIAFSDRRTPLPAILSAGRRMLRQPTASELWQIEEVKPQYPRHTWPDEVSLTLEKDGQSLSMTVGTVMGDKQTQDVWYPYWCVEKDASGMPPTGRERQFKGADGKDWVHVCDLREGDVVHLQPSRFDFEFLDTAARRFEIGYNNSKRQGRYHPARPYYLEQLDEFEELWNVLSQGLETTQIDNLIGIIEEKRIEWLADRNDGVFKQAVRDALNNANWKPSQRPTPNSEQFKQLYQAALSGQLADIVELYMHILKRPQEADKSQIETDKMGVSS